MAACPLPGWSKIFACARQCSKQVAAYDNLEFIAPKAVTGMDVDDHGVTAQLAGGGDLRGRLLIAADGRRSSIRELAAIKTVGWSYPQRGIVTTVQT